MTLEGGYHLKALKKSVRAVLREMSHQTHTSPTGFMAHADLKKKAAPAILRSIKVHGTYWNDLKI
jgi:acetoin utilization deacetylase AcuC-like enzyme